MSEFKPCFRTRLWVKWSRLVLRFRRRTQRIPEDVLREAHLIVARRKAAAAQSSSPFPVAHPVIETAVLAEIHARFQERINESWRKTAALRRTLLEPLQGAVTMDIEPITPDWLSTEEADDPFAATAKYETMPAFVKAIHQERNAS